MYTVVLALHSLVRWAVLASALFAAAVSWRGWLGGGPVTRRARLGGVALVASADTQVLLGLLLYFFLSPFTPARLADPVRALSEPGFRYWGISHPLTGLLVAAAAHAGSVLSRRAPDDASRHRRAAIAYGLALLLAAAAVPWPFGHYGRPLWPF